MDVVVVGERYEIVRELGKGAQGSTWLAIDLTTSAQVVVKELLLGLVDSWKGVELFEREGKALRTISHPGVPTYFDSFQVVEGEKTRFLIVQEYVDGKDLQAQLSDGLRMGEDALREFLRQMAEILRYLHGLSPVVIHRDIKPSNIMQNEAGRFLLVDFGAVQAVQADKVGGSTVIGTSGYMPAEQLVGRAVAASDLYALGVTAVYLASGVRPSDLPMSRMRIVYRDRVELSDDLLDLLDALLEPSVSLRLASAQCVLDHLDGKPKTRPKLPEKKVRAWQSGKGAGALVKSTHSAETNSVEITPVVQVSPWSGLVVMSGAYVATAIVGVMKFTPTVVFAVLMGKGTSVLASVLVWSVLGVLGVLWLIVWKNNHSKSVDPAQKVLED